jgi:hypothetical protein
MIAVFITIFVAVIVGVSIIGPISTQVQSASSQCGQTVGSITYGTYSGGVCTNGTQTVNTSVNALYATSTWGATVLNLVPGFFALIILGVVVAGLYTVFRQAGIV